MVVCFSHFVPIVSLHAASSRVYQEKRFFRVFYERLISSIYKLLLAGLLAYCLWYLWGLHQEHTRLLQHEDTLRARLVTEQKVLRDMQRAVERLRTDPAYVDMAIRRRLGYARPGELIFRFESQDDTPRPPPAPPAANDR